MKKAVWILAVVAISFVLAPSIYASKWGCECMLCMSNPGGAKQFKECQPPIRKLEAHLARGGRFPQCKESEENGYRTTNGYQPFYTCEEAYGEDYKLAEITEEGEFQTTRQVCRKLLGYRKQTVCDDETMQCREEEVPYYDTKDRQRRHKPNYVQLVKPDGTKSERVWYKKKKKKKKRW